MYTVEPQYPSYGYPDQYGMNFHNETYNADYGSSRSGNYFPRPARPSLTPTELPQDNYSSRLSPDPFSQRSSENSKQRLFVQNLPPFYEEIHLKQLFSAYGEISGVTIQRDRHGKSIQCAFVVFSVAADALNAMQALDGVMLSTQTLKIHLM